MHHHNRRSLLILAVFAIALFCAGPLEASRPNIVLIMSDDMGISDIGCYGSEIETPVLDGLAANGLRFKQFYNTARCCPTRASLLTGLYPHQAGIGHMMGDRGVDGYRGELNRHCVTIAQVLKQSGYATYMTGKWHVTKTVSDQGADLSNWPRQRGFDRFYGTIHGGGSLWDPNSLTRDNTHITPVNDTKYQPEGEWFYTDAISDNAATYIREHPGEDKPFFLYVSYTAAHWPMHAPERDILKYKGRYDAGYAPIRAQRYKKMKTLGFIEQHWALSSPHIDWADVTHKAWEARNMEVYAAMVDNMDQGIGTIVKALKASDVFDNTLIFFLQDNGGCAEGLGRRGQGAARASAPTLPPMGKDELQTSMIPKKTRRGYPVRQGVGVMAGPADTYIAYGRDWANVSNTPFREYKHWVHEGGIATPLIVHWPANVIARGEWRDTPAHLIDIMATCVDVAEASYPTQFEGSGIKPMEGLSLVPVFQGGAIDRDAIFWEHEKNCAVRQGKWKLVGKKVLKPDGPDRTRWELYDLDADRSELNNLADQHPDVVDALHAAFVAYCHRANVLPFSRKK